MSDFRIGSVWGFEIKIAPSWFVIFFLVLWSLSVGLFPSRYPGLGSEVYLVMGTAGSVLFFLSLLLHELSHALVARKRGVPIESITLFIFGGMAKTRKEPDTPRDEALIAGVGPLTSLGLALSFQVGAGLAARVGLGPEVWGVLHYLAFVNLLLAVFNMLPGFPLDGGRVFRAAVWAGTGDRIKATRWAASGGKIVGTFIMVWGGLLALAGNAMGGLWLIFIGWFLRSLAGLSFQQEIFQRVLKEFSAADLMTPGPSTVTADTGIEDLVRNRFMRLHHQSYPVTDAGAVVGLVTLRDVGRLQPEDWPMTTVAGAMAPLDDCPVVGPDTNLAEVLEAMQRSAGPGRALVMDGPSLIGIISTSDVTSWIQRVQALHGLVGTELTANGDSPAR